MQEVSCVLKFGITFCVYSNSPSALPLDPILAVEESAAGLQSEQTHAPADQPDFNARSKDAITLYASCLGN